MFMVATNSVLHHIPYCLARSKAIIVSFIDHLCAPSFCFSFHFVLLISTVDTLNYVTGTGIMKIAT